MALDSLHYFENHQDSPKLREGLDAKPRVDLNEYERKYRSLQEANAQKELQSAIRDILSTREAGQCLITGKWYVESDMNGVWLTPIELRDNPNRPRSFLAYSDLDDFLSNAAVPGSIMPHVALTHANETRGAKQSGESIVSAPSEPKRKPSPSSPELVMIEPSTRESLPKIRTELEGAVAKIERSFAIRWREEVLRNWSELRGGNPFVSYEQYEAFKRDPENVTLDVALTRSAERNKPKEKIRSGEDTKAVISHLDGLVSRYEKLPGNHERTKELFMNLRLGLSQDLSAPSVGIQEGETLRRAVDLVDYLADPDGYTGDKPNLWDIPGDALNLARYATSFGMQEAVAIVRDHTSWVLHKLGPEDAPYERLARNLLVGPNGEKPGNTPEEVAFEVARLPTAVVAGGLDGAFEVMQGGVDLATVPDKIAGNIASLVSALRTNAPAVWQAIEQSIDWSADRAYVGAYIASVLFTSVEFGPPGIASGLASIRSLLLKLGVSPETIQQIANGLAPVAEKAKELADRARAMNPIPDDKLPNIATLRKLGKTAFTRSDDTNTVRNTAAKGAEAAEEQTRKQASETLGKLGSDTMVANVFAKDVLSSLDNAKSDKENASFALDLCLRELSKDSNFTREHLEELKQGASTILTYRITLLQERTEQVREVLEKELLPLTRSYLSAYTGLRKNPDALLAFWREYDKKAPSLNSITTQVMNGFGR